MALILPGHTRCNFCGRPLREGEELVAFPSFFPVGHELHAFNDAAFHESCFAKWEQHEQMQIVYDRFRAVWQSRPLNASMEEMENWGKSAFDDVFR